MGEKKSPFSWSASWSLWVNRTNADIINADIIVKADSEMTREMRLATEALKDLLGIHGEDTGLYYSFCLILYSVNVIPISNEQSFNLFSFLI